MEKLTVVKAAVVFIAVLVVGYLAVSALSGAPAGSVSLPSAGTKGFSAPSASAAASASQEQPEPVRGEENADIVITGGDVPPPAGGKWWDWAYYGKYLCSMQAGAFGRTFVADGKNIYCLKPADGGFKNGALLYRFDTDGAGGELLANITDSMENAVKGSTMNLSNGFITYSTDSAVYRLKTDGTGLRKVRERPASDILAAGGKLLVRFSGDGNLYLSGETEDQALGAAETPFAAYDNGVLYSLRTDIDGKADLYFLNTATGKSSLLFKGLATHGSGLIAEDGKLVFFDGNYILCGTASSPDSNAEKSFKPGKVPGIVSLDVRTREKRTLFKVPEAAGAELKNLMRFDRFYVYTVEGKEDEKGLRPVSLWACDTKSFSKYCLASLTVKGGASLYITPENLYINDYKVVFYQGKAGLKKMKTDLFA